MTFRPGDDRREVVAQAVVGAARQDQHPGLGVVGDGLQHACLRHRAVQAVAFVDRRVQVHRPRARQDDAVVHRLVAVAVHHHHVARRQQRLEDDLVRRRRAAGGAVGLARTEGLRGQALRLRDDAGRVQQRIEPRHRHRQVGAQHLLADEGVEVAHPRTAAVGVAAGVTGRVPRVLGLRDVAAQLVVERCRGGLGDLGGDDAPPAGVVGLGAVEVAVDGVAGQCLDHQPPVGVGIVEQQVDRHLGPLRRDRARQRHDGRRVEPGVVDQHRVHVAAARQGRRRLLGRTGHPLQRPRHRIEPTDGLFECRRQRRRSAVQGQDKDLADRIEHDRIMPAVPRGVDGSGHSARTDPIPAPLAGKGRASPLPRGFIGTGKSLYARARPESKKLKPNPSC